MMLFKTIKENFVKYKDEIAFYIEETAYTYRDFAIKVSVIQHFLLNSGIKEGNIVILNVYDDIETYASIFAIWFSGGTFVPLNSGHPDSRNKMILSQIDNQFALSSKHTDKAKYGNDVVFINTKQIQDYENEVKIIKTSQDRLMYILFTSGSTGIPKGVPVSLQNLTSFIEGFIDYGFDVSWRDRFLQIYDLTFDGAIPSYLFPVFIGSSIFTVSPKKIKFLEAYRLIEKHKLTFIKFPPSVLTYLKPYFGKIKLPEVRYCLLGGEGLNYNFAGEWQKCIPNAQIHNVYGPTEATVITHIFHFKKDTPVKKTHNGILAIGKPMGENIAIIADEKLVILPENIVGELCLTGRQLVEGYWKNDEANKNSFFKKRIGNNHYRFYRTGDLVYIDSDGDFIYCGRMDDQVQIQGFRVELSEITNTAKKFGKAANYIALSRKNVQNIDEIILFAEKLGTETEMLLNFLKENLPGYMVPRRVVVVEDFPMTASGKVDRMALINLLKSR